VNLSLVLAIVKQLKRSDRLVYSGPTVQYQRIHTFGCTVYLLELSLQYPAFAQNYKHAATGFVLRSGAIGSLQASRLAWSSRLGLLSGAVGYTSMP
jgi:hypothetical protein